MANRYVWSKYNANKTFALSKAVYGDRTAASSGGTIVLSSSYSISSSGTISPSGNIKSYEYKSSDIHASMLGLGSSLPYAQIAGDMYTYSDGLSYAPKDIYVVRNQNAISYRHWETGGTYAIIPNGVSKLSATVTSCTKGSTSYGYVTRKSKSYYPSNNYSGSYWYVYQGYDCIDPTALMLSAKPKAGDTVTVTATARANTYGGTISYLYEYSVDGGNTWITIETTTATTTTVTVPDGAEQFQARVRASDNMGFTSTDYVSTDNLKIGGGIGYCGVEGAIRGGAFHACVDGVIKTDFSIYTCVGGVIKECA